MISIVVLDKGFVAVGTLAKEKDGWYSLDNASIIRRWGTSKGLGEIAENGPTPSTILDLTPKMKFPEASINHTIDCVDKKWKKPLER